MTQNYIGWMLIAFLKGDLHDIVYMAQLEGFVVEGEEHMGCGLNKSIYGLKQASR
jgi:hypothetical protein